VNAEKVSAGFIAGGGVFDISVAVEDFEEIGVAAVKLPLDLGMSGPHRFDACVASGNFSFCFPRDEAKFRGASMLIASNPTTPIATHAGSHEHFMIRIHAR
jgi:hypothetical protein